MLAALAVLQCVAADERVAGLEHNAAAAIVADQIVCDLQAKQLSSMCQVAQQDHKPALACTPLHCMLASAACTYQRREHDKLC